MSSVTGPGPNSLKEYTTEETIATPASKAKKRSGSTRVENSEDQTTPKRNLRSAKSTQTSPIKVASVPKESETPASGTSSDEEVTARSASTTGDESRADRKTKKFVTSSKDPRAFAHEQLTEGKKRAAEDKKGGRAKRQVRSSQELGLTYNSIKAINMPPRLGLVPGHVPPAPVHGTFPYGDTEDHQNSMIIYWLDDLEYTYAKATQMYIQTFPNDAVTDEAVRRRHIRSLERLQKRYGAKPVAQIGLVGKNISRRGRPRAPRLSGIEPENDIVVPSEEQAEGGVSAIEEESASTSLPLPKRSVTKAIKQVQREKRNHKGHEFDKACIVVWRDADKMSFKDIRDKLDNERGWSLGEPTIKKEYTRARARIWGTTSPELVAEDADEDDEKVVEDGEDEDMDMEGDSIEQKEI
jgi:hypothetical protein